MNGAGKEIFVTQFLVDETHSNPYSIWLSQNKPTAPSEDQWQALRKAQHLALVQPVSKKTVDTSFSTSFALNRQAGTLIILGTKRPLTGRNALVEIEGEDYDGQSGATKEDSADSTLGQSLSLSSGGYVFFENVDYTDDGVSSLQLRVKSQSDTTLELHGDSQTGTLLGKCSVSSTSNAWATQNCTLGQPVTGVARLYVVAGGAVHLNWLKFQSVGSTGTGGAGGTNGGGAGGASGAGGAVVGAGGGAGGNSSGGASGNPVDASIGASGGAAGYASGGSSGMATGGAAGNATGGGTSAGGATGGRGGAAGNASGGSSAKATGGAAGNATGSGTSAGGATSGAAGASGGSTGTSGASSGGGGNSGSGGSSAVPTGGGSSGCGCRIGNSGGSPGALLIVGLAAVLFGLRRQRTGSRHGAAVRSVSSQLTSPSRSGHYPGR